jgi:hypothetical protein
VADDLSREDVLLPERRQQQDRERGDVEDEQPRDGRPEQEPEPAAWMRVQDAAQRACDAQPRTSAQVSVHWR